MASTSSSSIVLPSIHEMFPEHLMPRSASRPRAAPMPAPTAGVLPRSHLVQSQAGHAFSFDVLKSDPRGASLQHIASSRPPGRRSDLPAVRTGPSSGHSSSGSSDGDAEMEDAEDGADGEEGVTEEGKKHVCPTCSKRFNRPSSLRIHVNTHTGATPFRCPHPNCGRAFNVNSNMRRHFRNHTSPAFGTGGGLSFPSNASSPISPTSPPSASWSASSASSYSPTTPSSAYSSQAAFFPGPLPLTTHSPRAWTPPSASLSPVSTWSPGPGVQKGYSESDVRSERR